MNKQIIIKSNNQYADAFPNRKIISRNTLHLIKILRSNGIEVIIEGPENTELEYFIEKGFKMFISNPIHLFLVNIPITVFLGIISSGIYDNIKGQMSNGIGEEQLIIQENNNGTTYTYSEKGLPLSAEKIKELFDEAQKNRTINIPTPISPDPSNYPCPIYLEHTSKIVGWCLPYKENDKLHVKSRITDDNTWKKIKNGTLKGFSIGAIVNDSKCSICGEQYIKCNHITGQKYKGKKCINNITSSSLYDISIVSDPVNADCLLDLSKVK